MKLPIIERPEYTVFFEPVPYKDHILTFIHCDIRSKWSKSVKERLKRDFEVLTELRESPIFALHTIGDHKHLKFISLFGFKLAYEGSDLPDNQFYVLEK